SRVAILEDDRLVELLVDRPNTRRMVGDIYLGTVDAVLPGIQAAFVNIGTEKSAFLHASDLIESEDEDEPHDPDDENGNGGGSGNGGGGGGGGGGGRGRVRRPLPDGAEGAEEGEAKPVQGLKETNRNKGPRGHAAVAPG